MGCYSIEEIVLGWQSNYEKWLSSDRFYDENDWEIEQICQSEVDAALLLSMAEQKIDWRVRYSLASHCNRPPILSLLAADEHLSVRRAVAENIYTDAADLAVLAMERGDNSGWVRWAVARNRNTPQACLLALALSDDDIRAHRSATHTLLDIDREGWIGELMLSGGNAVAEVIAGRDDTTTEELELLADRPLVESSRYGGFDEYSPSREAAQKRLAAIP